MSDFIPNSYQTPNILVDQLMPLLHPEEWMALSFAVRQILGFQDRIAQRQAHISLSKFAESGLPESTLRKALGALDHFRILVEVGDPTQEGQLWKLAFDDPQIDLEGLRARKETEHQAAAAKTLKARQAAAEKKRCVVPQHTGCSVPQYTPELDRPREEVCCPTTQGVLSHNRNQTQHDDDEMKTPDSSDSSSSGHPPTPFWSSTDLQIVQAECRSRIGFSKPLREALFKRTPEDALGLIFQAAENALKNPGGYLLALLRSDSAPTADCIERARHRLTPAAPPLPPPFVPVPLSPPDQEPGEVLDQKPEELAPVPVLPPALPPLPEKCGIDTPLPGCGVMTARDAWVSLLGNLQVDLRRTSYETYLRGTEAWRFRNGVLSVKVAHRAAATWLTQQVQRVVTLQLERMIGAPTRIEWIYPGMVMEGTSSG